MEQFLEIVAEPQADAHAPARLVAFEHKLREQRSRAVLYRQRVREAEVVLGNDVWVDQAHRETPGEFVSFGDDGAVSVWTSAANGPVSILRTTKDKNFLHRDDLCRSKL